LVLLMMMKRMRMRIICLGSGRAHNDEYCCCYSFHISSLLLAATQYTVEFFFWCSAMLVALDCFMSRFAVAY
jgi:hypothetical protein